MYVLMNHNAVDTVTIASDIVGGAGVTQDSSITFRRSENINRISPATLTMQEPCSWTRLPAVTVPV